MGVFVTSFVFILLLFRRFDAHRLAVQPPVLINRFVINLRTIDSEMLTADLQQRQSTMQFRMSTNRLGNIGEMLQNGCDDDEPWGEENDDAEVDEAGHGETSAEA